MRFSGGTTFPAVMTVVCVLMLGLVAYAKASLPGEETGAPQPGDNWVAAYAFRVCDEEFALTGTPDEVALDASTGDPDKLGAGEVATDRDGIIHYHPVEGGATGKRAKLGVFLNIYKVKLSDDKLTVPQEQVGAGATAEWDVDEAIFVGTPCEGKEPVIKVRVWNDYTSGEFEDMVTDFGNIRLKKNGMVFVIAVVPSDKDYEIPRPASACDLENYGAIGSGSLCGSGPDTTSVDTTEATGSTVPGSTTPGTDVATTVAATGSTAPTTTG